MPTHERKRMVERLLKENVRLARENNKLLKKIRRAGVLDFWSRVIFFLFLIGVPFFLYQYYLQDYVVEFKNTYSDLRENITNLKDFPDRLSF